MLTNAFLTLPNVESQKSKVEREKGKGKWKFDDGAVVGIPVFWQLVYFISDSSLF